MQPPHFDAVRFGRRHPMAFSLRTHHRIALKFRATSTPVLVLAEASLTTSKRLVSFVHCIPLSREREAGGLRPQSGYHTYEMLKLHSEASPLLFGHTSQLLSYSVALSQQRQPVRPSPLT